MNCRRAQHDILLESSGELKPAAHRRLDAHTAGCPACSAFRRDAERVLAVQPGAARRPPARVMAAIRAEAGRSAAPDRALFLHPGFRPLLAAAAALLVLAGGWLATRPPRPAVATTTAAHDPTAELRGLLALVLNGNHQSPPGGATREANLRALAGQLLRLEGFSLDDDAGEEPGLMEPAGDPPISLRGRSTPAVPSGKYG